MDKTQLYLLENAKKFRPLEAELIRQALKDADDEKFFRIAAVEIRDPTMMFIISFFVGMWGVDRFMLGQTGLGIAKLLTCGGLWVWAIVDLFLIMDATKKSNFEKVQPYL